MQSTRLNLFDALYVLEECKGIIRSLVGSGGLVTIFFSMSPIVPNDPSSGLEVNKDLESGALAVLEAWGYELHLAGVDDSKAERWMTFRPTQG